MSFEYITEKNETKKLSNDEVSQLAERISSDFDNYNGRRTQNLEQSERLIKEIFFKKNPTKKSENKTDEEKYEAWKTKVKMCKTYMFYQVLKSFIWKNVYAQPNSMFDVSGENQESDNDSNKQKAALVDILDKMNYVKTCDKIIDYAMLHGELISFVAWKKKSEQYRKLVDKDDLLEENPDAMAAIANGKLHYIAEKPIYDNPYIYPVNPANFVFDAAQKDNWDDCPKIYRSWKVPEDIINNKYYKISNETAQQIKNEVDNDVNPASSQMNTDLEQKTNNSKTVEVLEHWGNLTLKDGTVLKNWHVVVVARKYVVRFEKNNRIVNPFTFGAWITDPETGRGISPLYCVLDLAEIQEDLMNRTCDMQTLQENPPIYAPKGFFDEEEVKLYPGKIIEFGDNLSPADIRPMEFAVSIFLNDVTYLSDLMAEISGIFPNMAGADEKGNKTATEISTKAQGQLTRLSMLIDTINQDLIVEDVKKIAKLCADFKSGREEIFVNSGNKKETIEITDKIRQAEYRYTYADRTATTERSNKADLVAQAVERFAKFIPLNAQEIFTWYMEQKDVENPERFLQQQDVIPAEIQELLLQNPQIRQLVDIYEQQKQTGNVPQPQAVIPDQSIPESQPLE
ncbi:hypothetical protein IJI31_06435 [bacterium]|nr:hypothetical protein [bacterium]